MATVLKLLLVLQAPEDQLQDLCGAITHEVDAKAYLLIIDDVWPEDFPLFQQNPGRLGLTALRRSAGKPYSSACVMTSRDKGLASAAAHIQKIHLSHATEAASIKILANNVYSDQGPASSTDHQV